MTPYVLNEFLRECLEMVVKYHEDPIELRFWAMCIVTLECKP